MCGPSERLTTCTAWQELLERLGEVDDEIADLFLAEEDIPLETLRTAIRRQVAWQRFARVGVEMLEGSEGGRDEGRGGGVYTHPARSARRLCSVTCVLC